MGASRLILNRFLFSALLILPCSLVLKVNAQSIRGAVVDSLTRKPLPEASVSLLSARDSSLVTFSITDGEGRFVFPNAAEGQYRLLVTYVGYRGKTRRVSVLAANPNPDVGTIDVVATSQTLGEEKV